MPTERSDGVNETSLDYRAGWCEALKALTLALQINGARCKRSEIAGLQLACGLANESYRAMLAKMRGE